MMADASNIVDATIKLSDWAIITATLAGPVLAVQAQKWIERYKERRGRKVSLFQVLMATRAARVSPEHVQALNMIDMIFYGSNRLGKHHRSKNEQAVLDAWKEYHDHLGTKADQANIARWTDRRDELFIGLLYAMASDVGYQFDRVQLRKGAYSPMAHGDLEQEQQLVRRLLIDVLSGAKSLSMKVQSFPIDEDVQKAQLELQQAATQFLRKHSQDPEPPKPRVGLADAFSKKPPFP